MVLAGAQTIPRPRLPMMWAIMIPSSCRPMACITAGATVTALAVLLVRLHLRRRLPKTGSALLLAVAMCLPPAIALQRVAAGRHFLSDTIFAVLFTLLLALALSALLRPVSRPVRWARPGQGAVPTDP